jgi:AcrR family transcriptional regulator
MSRKRRSAHSRLRRVSTMPTWTRKDAAVRRSEILEAAERLFNQSGFDRLSLATIADEAELSKASLYLHFADKEELFRALITQVLDQPMARVHAAAKSEADLHAKLFEMLWTKIGYFYSISRNSEHGQANIDSATTLAADIVANDRRTYARLIAGVLQDAMDRDEIDPALAGFSPKSLAETLIAATHGLARNDSLFVPERTHTQRVRGMVKAMIVGLSTK